MSFPKYEEYKDSGCRWLGKVPLHWNLHKLKHVADIVGGGTPSREKLEYWNGNIPWVSPKDMKSEIISLSEECITELGLKSSTTCLQEAGRVLMVIRSGILQHTLPVAINAVPVALNQDLKSISFDESKCLPEFFLRWVQGLNDDLLLAWANEGATVESINQTLMQNTILPLPDVDEQNSIASFLDTETSKIDGLVAEQRRLIELLKEKRQAVISHAVTKGLNPDAPMKPSGIPWLGDVPENWEVSPIKNLSYVNDGNHGEEYPKDSDSASKEDGVPFIRAGDFENFKIVEDDLRYISREKNESMRKGNLQENDILFVNRGATIEKVGVIDKNYVGANLNSQIAYLRVEETNFNHRYLLYFLSSAFIRETVVAAIMGGALPQYPIKNIVNLPVCHPQIEEQRNIAVHLDSITLKLDLLQAQAENAIALLQERRTALISAAVRRKSHKVDRRSRHCSDQSRPRCSHSR
jgi:type I restriction enzyme, S subunit